MEKLFGGKGVFMNNKFKKLIAVCLTTAVVLVATAGCDLSCYDPEIIDYLISIGKIVPVTDPPETTEETEERDPTEVTEPEVPEAQKIDLNGTEGTITITEAGSYVVTGSTDNGTILVDASKKDVIDITLDNATILNPSTAAIYVKKAQQVNITLNGKCKLETTGVFETSEDNKVNAVIYSKSDLTLSGDGAVIITAHQGKAVKCNDSLYITGGTYVIDSLEDAINGKDYVNITGGTFTINSSDDGIHSDGKLQIDGGTFNIDALEGLEATYVLINDGDITIASNDDGINASLKDESYEKPVVEINGGNIKITMAAGDTDGIDSNGDIIINGGYIDITGQSTCDYDGTATFNGGTLILNGEEATEIPNQFMGPPPVDEFGNPLPPPTFYDENGNPIDMPPMEFDENGNPLPPPPMYDENGNLIEMPPPPFNGENGFPPPPPAQQQAPVEDNTEAEDEVEETIMNDETVSTNG